MPPKQALPLTSHPPSTSPNWFHIPFQTCTITYPTRTISDPFTQNSPHPVHPQYHSPSFISRIFIHIAFIRQCSSQFVASLDRTRMFHAANRGRRGIFSYGARLWASCEVGRMLAQTFSSFFARIANVASRDRSNDAYRAWGSNEPCIAVCTRTGTRECTKRSTNTC